MITHCENAREAALVEGLEIIGVSHLNEVVDFLNGEIVIGPTVVNAKEEFLEKVNTWDIDFSDAKGQENVKRALEVAGRFFVIARNLSFLSHSLGSIQGT